MNETLNTWDQLEYESALAYVLFRQYMDMGGERTRAKVIEQSGRSEKLIHTLANKYRWTKRSRAFDRSLAKSEEVAVRKTLALSAAKRAQQWSEFSEEEFIAARLLVEKAKKIIAMRKSVV